MIETKGSDRRQAPRHALNTDVFLVFRPEFNRLGKLKDVSSGGVAFEYAVFENYEKVKEAEVDIFASEASDFMLRRLPCSVVYDTTVERSSLSGVETRRCGLKFEQLSSEQTELLKILLNNFTTHQLPGAVTLPVAYSR